VISVRGSTSVNSVANFGFRLVRVDDEVISISPKDLWRSKEENHVIQNIIALLGPTFRWKLIIGLFL
jgi:hypothetical protein